MSVTIFHNPLCGTSRGALAIIRERNIEPTIVEYLKTPLTKDQLKALVAKMGVPVKGEPDQRKVQWTFRPANAAAARVQTRREAGRDHKAQVAQ